LDLPENWAHRDISGDIIVGDTPDEKIFRYNITTSTYTTLTCPFLSPGDWSFVTGIDGDSIVGHYRAEGEDESTSRGFLYDGTTWTELHYPGAYGTRATGIDGDNIVGYYYDSLLSTVKRPFLYDGTTWTTLLDGSYPVCDVSGDYVVSASPYLWMTRCKSYLYDLSTSTLNSLNCPHSPNENTTYVQGVSGENVVGYYKYQGYHGFVLTVPEPGTLSVLGVGGLALLRRRRT